MRSEGEITNLILNVAESNDRIRAVLLNGSRANPKAKKDSFQDYDIVYIVREINSFVSDHSWIDVFGDRIILQMPEEMSFGRSETAAFPYLMLFKDGVRIDLTLFPIDELEKFNKDSLAILLLDKDGLFTNMPEPGEQDYWIKRPTEKEFSDCCNEFWWVSTNVAKGLYRNEITYAKEMLEIPVRAMFFKIIEWYIGINTNFSVSFGKGGKFMEGNLDPLLYKKIISTYPDAIAGNIWESLFTMTALFHELALQIAPALHFTYNLTEDENVTGYLNAVYKMTKEK
ncbi:MAG: aminoglycoside 6-adenylyltransferase [Bacteroidota bacterium]